MFSATIFFRGKAWGNQTGRSRGKLIGQLEDKEGKSLVPALLSAEVRIVER